MSLKKIAETMDQRPYYMYLLYGC